MDNAPAFLLESLANLLEELSLAAKLPSERWEGFSLQDADPNTRKFPVAVSMTASDILGVLIGIASRFRGPAACVTPAEAVAALKQFDKWRAAQKETYGDKPYWSERALDDIRATMVAASAPKPENTTP